MRLDNFPERDQNKIVQLAMKRRDYIVDYKGKQVRLPSSINALFICVDKTCNNTLDVTYYKQDVVDGNVASRVKCNQCGGVMNRRFIGVNINQILNQHIRKTDEYSEKDQLGMWFSSEYNDE